MMKAMLVAATLLLSFAGGVEAADLAVEGAWARATPKGAAVGAGYLTIRNDGAADRLTGVAVDFGDAQLHEMKMDGGVMQMRRLSGGLDIPAHATVQLAPGGYHLMFVGLKHPLVKGETVKATLAFEHAGPIVVDMPVAAIGASGPAPKM